MPVAFRSPQVECCLIDIDGKQTNEERPTREKEPWNVGDLVRKPSLDVCHEVRGNELIGRRVERTFANVELFCLLRALTWRERLTCSR